MNKKTEKPKRDNTERIEAIIKECHAILDKIEERKNKTNPGQ